MLSSRLIGNAHRCVFVLVSAHMVLVSCFRRVHEQMTPQLQRLTDHVCARTHVCKNSQKMAFFINSAYKFGMINLTS